MALVWNKDTDFVYFVAGSSQTPGPVRSRHYRESTWYEWDCFGFGLCRGSFSPRRGEWRKISWSADSVGYRIQGTVCRGCEEQLKVRRCPTSVLRVDYQCAQFVQSFAQAKQSKTGSVFTVSKWKTYYIYLFIINYSINYLFIHSAIFEFFIYFKVNLIFNQAGFNTRIADDDFPQGLFRSDCYRFRWRQTQFVAMMLWSVLIY